MGQLGDLLHQTREAKGLSLAQVEETTRIRCRILEALEQGAYDQLPAPVFVKGFLRNYAVLLGLNPEEIIQKYKEEAGEAATPYMPTALAEPLEAKRFPAWIGALFFILVLGVAAWWSYQQGWASIPQSLIVRLFGTSAENATPSLSPGETVTPAPAATDTPTPADTPTAALTLTPTAMATSTGTPTFPPTSTSTTTMTRTPSPTRLITSAAACAQSSNSWPKPGLSSIPMVRRSLFATESYLTKKRFHDNIAPSLEAWCSGRTCSPVKAEIAGSNPVASVAQRGPSYL